MSLKERQMARIRRAKSEGLSTVRSITVAKNVKRTNMSRQTEDTAPFYLDGSGNTIIPTPYDLSNLHKIAEKSNVLSQCITSYVTNICSSGYRVVPCDDLIEISIDEKLLLESFITNANSEESLTKVSSKQVTQYEKYGFSFVEVIRDGKGSVSLLRNAKSASMRILTSSETTVEVTYTVKRGGRRSKVKEMRRFKRYIQMRNGRRVYFREFGDPRQMDWMNGQYESNDYEIPMERRATEIMHNRQYSEDVYGVPRWIGQLPAILGSREQEEVNLRYFEDNTVPAAMLTVSGGRLTKQSFQDLKVQLESQGVGKDRQNKIILVEAVPEVTELDGKGTVKLDLHTLTDARQSDGLFQKYDESNQSKVRSSFRLPPVFIGLSEDHTYASVSSSAYIAEVQVFLPERRSHDEFLNKGLVNHPQGLNLKTVKLESKGPSVTNPEQIIKTLTALNVMGGLTPRTAIEMVNETIQLTLPQLPETGSEDWEDWMDQPLSLTLKMQATQQTGDAVNSPEMQAIKDEGMKTLEEDGDIALKSPENGQQ
jgi:PBSX family phage portal protein